MSRNNKRKKQSEETLPDFDLFMNVEEIESHDKVAVTKVSFNRGTKIAFWFIRIYIAVMVVLVIVGFSRV
jgi:t-SNARE complex subunit (syntaxin)